MDLGLKDKIVVVTGGSRGIGYATAQEFLKEGARVIITGRDSKRLEDAQKELQQYGEVRAIAGDGTSEEEVKRIAKEAASDTGGIDVWINNVGKNVAKADEFYSEPELDQIISAVFKSAVFGCQAAIPYMKEKGGSIVNIASLAARNATCGKSNIYAAMKAGLVALSKTLAGEYAAYHIRVNTILPGYTQTPLIAQSFTEEMLKKLLKNNLLQRMALPEEVAKPIVFLASDAASYITATSLEVTGGHNQVLNPEYSYEKKALESMS